MYQIFASYSIGNMGKVHGNFGMSVAFPLSFHVMNESCEKTVGQLCIWEGFTWETAAMVSKLSNRIRNKLVTSLLGSPAH